jgi:hypothetical protein
MLFYSTVTVVLPTMVTGMVRPCCEMVMERLDLILLVMSIPVWALRVAVPV